MAKIIGNTTATPNPRPDWLQTDETKADYIKNKPNINAGEGDYSIIQNGADTDGNVSVATGECSAALGYVTKAEGIGAFAEGKYTIAHGDYSHAEGYKTYATGRGSHTGGTDTFAGAPVSEFTRDDYAGVSVKLLWDPNSDRIETEKTDDKGNELTYYEYTNCVAILSNSNTNRPELFDDIYFIRRFGINALGYNQSGHKYEEYDRFFLQGHVVRLEETGETAIIDLPVRLGSGVWAKMASDGSSISENDSRKYVTFDLSKQLPLADGITYPTMFCIKTSELAPEYANPASMTSGIRTIASGTASFATGSDTMALKSYADASGYFSVASATAAHAEGIMTSATGVGSHAEGGETTATGERSHVEGSGSKAHGKCSHAEGINAIAGTYDDDTKQGQHAEGQNTTATGVAAHAEGSSTEATGDISHAEGIATTTFGRGSHTEGYDTIAYGETAHSEGYQTNAYYLGSHSEGRNTASTGYYSHAEGYNTTAGGADKVDDLRKTPPYATDASYNLGQHAEGVGTIASGFASHAEGHNTTASGEAAHSEGYNTTASGARSHAEGQKTTAIGYGSHAEGGVANAHGMYTHAEGYDTNAFKNYAHAEGLETSAGTESGGGAAQHAEGYKTTASGDCAHAEGNTAIASGNFSHAEGQNTNAAAKCSHAEGRGTITNRDGQHVEGTYNITEWSAFHITGCGLSDTDRDNCFTAGIFGSEKYIKIGDTMLKESELVSILSGKSAKYRIKEQEIALDTKSLAEKGATVIHTNWPVSVVMFDTKVDQATGLINIPDFSVLEAKVFSDENVNYLLDGSTPATNGVIIIDVVYTTETSNGEIVYWTSAMYGLPQGSQWNMNGTTNVIMYTVEEV